MADFQHTIIPMSAEEMTMENDIELSSFDAAPERPRSPHRNSDKTPQYGHRPDESEDEDSSDCEGSRALLGLESQERTRGSEQHPGYLDGLWPQIKNIVIESAPTLLLSTIGLVFTGELLNQVSWWKAMKAVDQLIIIIPVILNLKGNLEMNLTARLGTAANMGELNDPKTRHSMILGNMALLQVQGAVVSFFAACFSFVLGFVVPRRPPPSAQISSSFSNMTSPLSSGNSTSTDLHNLTTRFILHSRVLLPPRPVGSGEVISGVPEFILVAATAMASTCLSSLLLGSFMCVVIVLCLRYGRDPDNIAPPIATGLGDLVTLVIIGVVSTILIHFIHTPVPCILGLLVVLFSLACAMFTSRNYYVKDLIKEGWSPLFGAMVISCGTGIVLDMFVSRYEGFALLAIVISGLPGSVGSIFVSRLSTALHAAARSYQFLPSPHNPSSCNSREPSPRVVMITLLAVTLPIEIVFLVVVRAFGWLHLPFIFAAFSVGFFCCAVLASLIIAEYLTNFLWSKRLDPDMYALPIHSALMDLIGQLLLVLCFEIVSLLGAQVGTKPPN